MLPALQHTATSAKHRRETTGAMHAGPTILLQLLLPVSQQPEKEASEAGPSAPSADCHAVQPGKFVMVKKHEKVRKSGNKHGKLADKVHGPYILHHFTDSSQQVAMLQDAADNFDKQRTADLRIYCGTR
ncbi:TPA: hypothetical protein ACH3X2_005313 [Trebouxia sp. C0005]